MASISDYASLTNYPQEYTTGIDVGMWTEGVNTYHGSSAAIQDSTLQGLLRDHDLLKQRKEKEKRMASIREFRDLELSEDERLLRKHGLRDSENDWTPKAIDLLDQMLLDEKRDTLVEKCRKLDELNKESK